MATKTLDQEEGARAFARFLEQLADGEAHAELSVELHSLMGKMSDAADAVGKSKGELTINFKFAMERGTVGISYDLKVKEPKPARPKGVMWLTKGNNLATENPKQAKLPLRDVNSAKAPARDVDEPAAAVARDVK